MKIAFYSNFLNHHQLPICNEMVRLLGEENFTFVACEPIDQERLDMGYADLNRAYPFVLRAYEDADSQKRAKDLAMECDAIVLGSAPREYVDVRMAMQKLTFRYSERLFKKGRWRRFIPMTHQKVHQSFLRYKDRHLYVLCSSAYTAYDLGLCGFPADNCFKWGYFPEVHTYDIDVLLENKCNQPVKLLWAGRFLDWKRAKDAIKIAERLKRDGYSFTLDLIGTGPCEARMRRQVEKMQLQDYVSFLGSMSPQRVREHMERANIYLFTSNFYEGWGAVLNEAMNSGCAVVASHAIGVAPYLLQHGQNGLVYQYGKINDFYTQVKRLMDDSRLREACGKNAYFTLHDTWNASVAANRFVEVVGQLISNEPLSDFSDGPCSKADIVHQNWHRSGKR